MYYFVNDYSEGCTPEILKRLEETNLEKTAPYGADVYSLSAKEKIRKACGAENAEVFFLSGGTQTNALMIDSLCDDFGAVLCADTGHINAHESGAVEFTGHKVIGLFGKDGKLSCKTVSDYMRDFCSNPDREHMAYPQMIYLSHPTEYGTLYSKEELKSLYQVAREYSLKLYIDGARLGYGLVCKESDLSLSDIAENCDAFYIGGTKVGALFGEAAVFSRGNVPSHMLNRIKRHGALLAKGRITGLQFDTLFTDGLYEKIARHAIDCAERLREILRDKGYSFYLETPTNQIFVIVENKKMEELARKVGFSFWEKLDDDHTVIRFVTSWATDTEDVEALGEVL